MTVVQPGSKVFSKERWFEETGYGPHPGQRRIHFDPHRHRVVCNGRRWGKTLLGGKEVEPRAFVVNRLGEPQHGWIVGPEFKDAEKEYRIVYDTFKKLGVDTVSSKFLKNVENGNMVIKTKWGFWLECRSALHAETLVGEGLDFVLMVEAGRHKRKTWTEYIRPALSDKRGWSLHTGVPEGATNTSLLYHLWNRGQTPEVERPNPKGGVRMVTNPWRSWRMPSWTNTVTFPGGRRDAEILDAEDDLTAEEFDRQYGAKFVERVGRVMAEWDDDYHLADLRYDRTLPTYMAVDYGFTNPFVILWIQVDPFGGVRVIHEKRWRLKDATEVAKDVMGDPLLGPLAKISVCFYPDPASPEDTETLKRELKKPARTNTGGTIQERLKLIWRAMKIENAHLPDGHADKKAGLQIDRHHCPELVWEMREGYRWPQHKTDRAETQNDSENPMDKDNHGPEALGRFAKGYLGVVGRSNVSRQRKARMGSGQSSLSGARQPSSLRAS